MKILYLSLGPTCQPVYYLEYFGLRKFSSPFDWLGYNLDTAIKLYKSDFKSFFCEYIENESDSEYRNVTDTKNNILSMHNISKDIELKQSIKEFKTKTKKRWRRLKKEASNSNLIVFLCAYKYDYEALKYFLYELADIFNKQKLMLINVNDSKKQHEKKVHKINNKMIVIEYFFYDNREEDWKGNVNEWYKIIQDIYIDKFNFIGGK